MEAWAAIEVNDRKIARKTAAPVDIFNFRPSFLFRL
jgi:hypothetical protein